MDKEEFIKKLSEELKITEERAHSINSILEDHFLIGKKEKEKLTSKLEEVLKVSKEEANNIYNTAHKLLYGGIKDTLKHPFRSKD